MPPNFATPLTLGTLRAQLAELSRGLADRPVKVWLPGSTIRLYGAAGFSPTKNAVLLEGNIEPGSVLEAMAGPQDAYVCEDHVLDRLKAMADRLQGRSDRERDEGHKLSLMVNEIRGTRGRW